MINKFNTYYLKTFRHQFHQLIVLYASCFIMYKTITRKEVKIWVASELLCSKRAGLFEVL